LVHFYVDWCSDSKAHARELIKVAAKLQDKMNVGAVNTYESSEYYHFRVWDRSTIKFIDRKSDCDTNGEHYFP